MQKNQLAEEYNVGKLMKFTAPTMIMLVFMSLYQTMDAVFISNLVSELGLTALNVVYPFTSVVIAISIMLATGAGAIIALDMGMQKKSRGKAELYSCGCSGACTGIYYYDCRYDMD